jgi:ribosomal protein L29
MSQLLQGMPASHKPKAETFGLAEAHAAQQVEQEEALRKQLEDLLAALDELRQENARLRLEVSAKTRPNPSQKGQGYWPRLTTSTLARSSFLVCSGDGLQT